MPALGPISQRDLVRRLRALGFAGPYTGTGKHPEYLVWGERQIRLPNPHRGDVGVALLGKILDQAGVTRDEWQGILMRRRGATPPPCIRS